MAAIEFASTPLFSDANLKAYYKLEDTSDSKSSYTLTNTGSTPFNAAKFNNGADFGTGNTTKILSVANAMGITGNISFGGWVKLNAEPSNGFQGFFSHGENTQKVNYGIYYQDSSGTKNLYFQRNKQNGADQSADALGITALGTSVYHLIVGTYDGTNLRLYLDGSLAAGPTAASGTGTGTATDTFRIGDVIRFTPLRCNAIIDDVFVFNRVLTATEISNLYTGNFPVLGSMMMMF